MFFDLDGISIIKNGSHRREQINPGLTNVEIYVRALLMGHKSRKITSNNTMPSVGTDRR